MENRKGSIGITIVMLVFCLLMSVSMSYHKTIQTEKIIQNNTNYSDRAIDAAFSGVNYAMALIQTKKSVFNGDKIEILKPAPIQGYESKWISLSSEVGIYYDSNRKEDKQKIPPYRFIVSCAANSYMQKLSDPSNPSSLTIPDKFYIKSYGEYYEYEYDNENDKEEMIATYSAQIIAECILDVNRKTISLKRYRRMQPQNPDTDTITTDPGFYKFNGYNEP